jgi:hypothetical protein
MHSKHMQTFDLLASQTPRRLAEPGCMSRETTARLPWSRATPNVLKIPLRAVIPNSRYTRNVV